MSLSRFFLFFFGLCLIIGAVAQIIESENEHSAILIPKFWVIFGFIAALTLIAYFMSLWGIKKAPETSVLLVMGAVVLKLLISMSFVLVYLLKFKVNAVHFASQFFSIYFLFTGFEVYALLCNLRHPNKK